LTTPKSSFVKWCDKNKVEYLNDPGNYDEKFMRPIVRHTIVPACLKVNPGLRKVIKKKVKKDYKQNWENKK
jgi:tRNA(Ile)-lysidine synthase TilS/MesJ